MVLPCASTTLACLGILTLGARSGGVDASVVNHDGGVLRLAPRRFHRSKFRRQLRWSRCGCRRSSLKCPPVRSCRRRRRVLQNLPARFRSRRESLRSGRTRRRWRSLRPDCDWRQTTASRAPRSGPRRCNGRAFRLSRRLESCPVRAVPPSLYRSEEWRVGLAIRAWPSSGPSASAWSPARNQRS